MTERRKNRLEYVLKNTIPLLIFLQIILIIPTKQPSLKVPHEIAQIPC